MAEHKKHKKPHKIITTRAKDGSFGHDHVHIDEHGHESAPVFAGTSRDMDDLHQHMDDHFGGEEGGEAAPTPGPEAEAPAPGME